MKDYNVTLKVRNNFLLTAMRNAGFESVPPLARAAGVSAGTIYDMLNLKETALTGAGVWRAPVARLAEFLGCCPADIYPPQHIDKALPFNKGELEVGAEDLAALAGSSQQALPDFALDQESAIDALNIALSELRPRELEFLKLRYYEGMKFSEIGEHHGVSLERARQIIKKAERKLKRPKHRPALREALDVIAAQEDVCQ